MTKPIIHLNGSGRDNLLKSYSDAIDSIHDLKAKLAQTAPHPRDYYLNEDKGAFSKARDEHFARVAKIEEVEAEITALGLHVIENS